MHGHGVTRRSGSLPSGLFQHGGGLVGTPIRLVQVGEEGAGGDREWINRSEAALAVGDTPLRRGDSLAGTPRRGVEGGHVESVEYGEWNVGVQETLAQRGNLFEYLDGLAGAPHLAA